MEKKNYRILGEFIKDISAETKDIESYIYTKENNFTSGDEYYAQFIIILYLRNNMHSRTYNTIIISYSEALMHVCTLILYKHE